MFSIKIDGQKVVIGGLTEPQEKALAILDKLPAGELVSRDGLAKLAMVAPTTIAQWTAQGLKGRKEFDGYHECVANRGTTTQLFGSKKSIAMLRKQLEKEVILEGQ